MAVNYKFELVGVFGYPVAENPTCVMQEAAFAELGLQWRYLTIEVKPEALPDAVKGLRAMNFRGINLTIPHKVAVMSLLDEISPDAAQIGAVNTVRRAGDRLIGENTDGKGFLRGVREEAGLDPRGSHVVVLGAGGAARAITVELAHPAVHQYPAFNRGLPEGAGGEHASGQAEGVRVELKDGKIGKNVLVRVEELVIVNAVTLTEDPQAVGAIIGLRWLGFDAVAERILALISSRQIVVGEQKHS